MANSENLQKQIGYLKQCLSSDKKPLGFFLGAGCPMAVDGPEGEPPLIPDILGITKMICDELSKCPEHGPLYKIIEDNFKKDLHENVTVEDMLSHIRSLRAVAGNDQVRGLTSADLDKLDSKICESIHMLADRVLPNNRTPYHRLALWADAVKRENPVEVFTTNYDLLMEQAFEECRVPFFDGFAGSKRPSFDIRAMEEDELPPRWARLWKLHGSINWYQEDAKGVFRGASQEEGSKRVIHPSHLKYEESRRMPYLAMIDRLRAFLKQKSVTLIICGYSFRDEHINEVIMQGLRGTQTAIAFALLFGGIEQYPTASRLAQDCPNLSIFARNGAVVSGLEAEWEEIEREALEAGKWVKWSPKEDGGEGKLKAELLLGDFATFGQFCYELIGYARNMEIGDGQ